MMRRTLALLVALLGTAGCGSVPRFVMHPVGTGFDLARLQELHARYERPIVVFEGRVYVPDWGCVCELGLVVEGAELLDPRSERLSDDVEVEPTGEDVEARPPLVCWREEEDGTVFRVASERDGTAYVFDGTRLAPVRDGVVPLQR